MSNRFFYGILTVLSVVFLGFFISYSAKSKPTPKVSNADIVSRTAIHWHPELRIFVKGQEQAIPANIGEYGRFPGQIHTHGGPQLHYENNILPITKDKVTLGAFFKTWGQPFDATDLLSYKNVPKGSIKMTVNGKPNTQFENYQVRDKDKIVISYN